MIGLTLQLLCVATLDITINLYVMDHLPRRQFLEYEPMRAAYSALAYVIGPVAGVWLATEVAPWTPFAISGFAAVLFLVSFWLLRWSEHPAVQPMRQRPPNPLVYLPRFFRQPRLRLAYLLASSRSAWWAMFTIYAPIFAVELGFGPVAAGAFVSAGLTWLILARVWGALARKYGIRGFLIAIYILSGITTMGVALAGDSRWLGITILLVASFIISALEGVGNGYFLRAVRPLERPEMTTVFTTYREAGQTVAPGIFAALLRVFELPAVFVASGASLLLVAWYARHIPRGL
jgi:MFS family permease